MAEPASVCCLIAFLRRLNLCKSCIGSEEEDDEGGGGGLSLQASNSNSCRNWMCCTGSECCVSKTTQVIGSSRVVVGEKRKSGFPGINPRTVEQLFLQDDEESPVDDDVARKKATNKFVLEQLEKMFNSPKSKVAMPRVAIIAAVRELPDVKFTNWDENSEVELTKEDIEHMKAAVRAEKARVTKVRTALMQKHMKTKAASPKRSSTSSDTDDGTRRRNRGFGRKTLKVKVGEGKKGTQDFNVVHLARDILALTTISAADALVHAKAIKHHFKYSVEDVPTPQDIWNYLEIYVLEKNLPLKDAACGQYEDQATFTDIAQKTTRVAELTFEQYLALRDHRTGSPGSSPVQLPQPEEEEDDITPVGTDNSQKRGGHHKRGGGHHGHRGHHAGRGGHHGHRGGHGRGKTPVQTTVV